MKKTIAAIGVVGLAASSLAFTATSASASKSNPTNCYKEFGYFHVLHNGDGLRGKDVEGDKITMPVPKGPYKLRAKHVNKKSNCAAASHLFTQWLAKEKIGNRWRFDESYPGFTVSKGKKVVRIIYAGS